MNLSQRTDAEVLASSVDDSEAFLLILDRHFDRIAAYVARRSDVSQREELSSEVFVRAFANRRRYDPTRAEVVPWLYGIATNVLRESRREERRQLALLARARALAGGGRPLDSTDVVGPLTPSFVSALVGLSSDEREPLLLYALADLDYEQIAAALEVPLGTVKSRINRARELLRRELDDGGTIARFAKEGVSSG